MTFPVISLIFAAVFQAFRSKSRRNIRRVNKCPPRLLTITAQSIDLEIKR